MEWLTDNIDHPIICIIFFLAGLILGHIAPLELPPTTSKQPIVVYKTDNQGAEIFGKVVEKGRHGKLYTITIRDYGVFVVTKDVYEKVKVGDEVRI